MTEPSDTAVDRRARYAAAMDAVTGGICPADLIDAVMAVADAELATHRADTLREAADICDEAGSVYGSRGADDAAGAAFALMERFQRKADEAEYVATPCDPTNPCEDGGEPCHVHERLQAHAEGDHCLCAPDCGLTPAVTPFRYAPAAAPAAAPSTDQATPSRRAGLRDELVTVLGQIQTIPPVAHRRAQADNVLAVLYREWPWLRAEAEDAAPSTDQAALRERYDAAIRAAGDTAYGNRPFYEAITDAVIALAEADRAAARAEALREAADRYDALADQNEAYDREQGDLDEEARLQHGTVRDVAAGLRHMAGEAHPPTSTWKVESPRRDQWASWGAAYDERVWAAASFEDVVEVAPQRPFRLVRATTTYVVEAEHQPEPAVVEPAEAADTETDGAGRG